MSDGYPEHPPAGNSNNTVQLLSTRHVPHTVLSAYMHLTIWPQEVRTRISIIRTTISIIPTRKQVPRLSQAAWSFQTLRGSGASLGVMERLQLEIRDSDMGADGS